MLAEIAQAGDLSFPAAPSARHAFSAQQVVKRTPADSSKFPKKCLDKIFAALRTIRRFASEITFRARSLPAAARSLALWPKLTPVSIEPRTGPLKALKKRGLP